MVDYARAIWLPNDNFFPDRNGFKPRWIICHGTAGGAYAQALGTYFQSTQGKPNATSSNYGIGQDGTICQYVAEKDGAWANGALTSGHDAWWDPTINPNNVTISIEHCKPSSDNSDALTAAQKTASFELIRDICRRWNIPMRAAGPDGGITGHFSTDPINRSRCPGPFPWEQLWAFLKEGTMLELNDPVVQVYFTDGGNGTWKCKKNGVRVWGENLKFYRSNGGPALLGLPLAEEIHIPLSPEIAIVPCERALIVYDPKRKIDNPPIAGPCYLLHLRGGIGGQLLAQNATETIQGLMDKINQIKEIIS